MAETLSLHDIGDGDQEVWHAHGDSHSLRGPEVEMNFLPVGGKIRMELSENIGESGTVEVDGHEVDFRLSHADISGKVIYEAVPETPSN